MTRLRALFLVVRRSLQQHRLAGMISAFSIALATALLMTVTSVQHQATQVFIGQGGGFDGVLGARGSALQLVLSSLYHMESSPGNLPWEAYQAMRQDPQVAHAVPLAIGDNYRGFRIVGTTSEFFRAWRPALEVAHGRFFEDRPGEAVIGSWVAQQSGLKLGSTFNPYHGLNYDESARHAEVYTVVGILAPSNSPQDRAIWIPIEGVFRMSGHVLRGGGEEFVPQPEQEIPDAHKEVSGVLLRFKSPQSGMHFDQLVNRQGKVATLAWPVARIVLDLFERMGWMVQILRLLSFLVLLVAAAAITASLCNTLHERRREFGILRALGAGRGFVAAVLLCESCWLAMVGTFWGFWVYYLMMWTLSQWVRIETGIQLDPLAFHQGLWMAPLVVMGMGFLSGLLPMILVYRGSLAPQLGASS